MNKKFVKKLRYLIPILVALLPLSANSINVRAAEIDYSYWLAHYDEIALFTYNVNRYQLMISGPPRYNINNFKQNVARISDRISAATTNFYIVFSGADYSDDLGIFKLYQFKINNVPSYNDNNI